MRQRVKINSIKVSRDYVRSVPAENKFTGNIVYPIVVDKENHLIDGLGRLEELKKRSVRNVDVIVVNTDDRHGLSLKLALQRSDLNPMDKAVGIRRFMEKHSLSGREAAKMLGISKTNVEDHLQLLKLPDEVQEDVRSGKTKMYQVPIYKTHIRTVKQFADKASDIQYRSMINRLSSFEILFSKSTLDKEKIQSLIKSVIGIKYLLEERLKTLNGE